MTSWWWIVEVTKDILSVRTPLDGPQPTAGPRFSTTKARRARRRERPLPAAGGCRPTTGGCRLWPIVNAARAVKMASSLLGVGGNKPRSSPGATNTASKWHTSTIRVSGSWRAFCSAGRPCRRLGQIISRRCTKPSSRMGEGHGRAARSVLEGVILDQGGNGQPMSWTPTDAMPPSPISEQPTWLEEDILALRSQSHAPS